MHMTKNDLGGLGIDFDSLLQQGANIVNKVKAVQTALKTPKKIQAPKPLPVPVQRPGVFGIPTPYLIAGGAGTALALYFMARAKKRR